MSTLLFDIGGTAMRMAVGEDLSVERMRRIPTPEDPADAITALVAFAEEIEGITSVSGGIAGIVEDGTVRAAPHLPSWDGFPFGGVLEDALSVPVRIRNDAELAAIGEALVGAGKGYGLVAYVGIGTGVGGAYVVNGEAVRHVHGFEPGHQILDIDTGATFESLVSGHALEKRFGMPAKDVPQEVYDELAPTLAAGLYNVILEWSPEILVLGGSLMSETRGYRIDLIERALAAIPSILPALPLVRRALLGDENGLYGALSAHTPR